MPDPIALLTAIAASAAAAAIAFLLGSKLAGPQRPSVASASAILGLALGFAVGCHMLEIVPQWPPVEDKDRFLLILLPVTILAELVALAPGRVRYASWLLRLATAGGAGWAILHNSIYITDLAGPNSREWSPDRAWLILGILTVVLGIAWASLGLLAGRPSGRSVPLAIAFSTAGAAGAVALSGYASGGQIGLPLAAALFGISLTALVLPTPCNLSGVVGIGVVGSFGLLAMGRFFGSLPTFPATLLFLAPLLAWIPEIPLRFRALARLGLTAMPVGIAMIFVVQNFIREAGLGDAPAKSAEETSEVAAPSVEDYLNFRK